MPGGGQVRGLAEVTRNLNVAFAQIKGDVTAGLLEAGLQIQGSSQRRVPVEHGNLKASAYTRKAMDATTGTAVEVGYTSAYAVFVHENMEQKLKGVPRPSGLGHYWGPNGAGPKFLQNAVAENESGILEIVRRRAEVK
jgi:hypothetical protein